MKGVTGVVILPFENTKNEKRGIERERKRVREREKRYGDVIFFKYFSRY